MSDQPINKNTQTAAPPQQYTVTSKREPAGPTAFERQFGPDPALKHGATAQAIHCAHLSGWNAALKAVRNSIATRVFSEHTLMDLLSEMEQPT